MLFLSEQEMWQSVTLEDVMDAIEDAYAIHKSGNYKMPDRFIAQRDKNMMLYMPCFLDSVIGTKMLSEFPDNPSLGIPYLNGLMILNNAKTGLPKAIMNGSGHNHHRSGQYSSHHHHRRLQPPDGRDLSAFQPRFYPHQNYQARPCRPRRPAPASRLSGGNRNLICRRHDRRSRRDPALLVCLYAISPADQHLDCQGVSDPRG